MSSFFPFFVVSFFLFVFSPTKKNISPLLEAAVLLVVRGLLVVVLALRVVVPVDKKAGWFGDRRERKERNF